LEASRPAKSASTSTSEQGLAQISDRFKRHVSSPGLSRRHRFQGTEQHWA
jgi:hypothetical protein